MLFAILPPAARALGLSPFRISTIFAASASIWVFVSPWWGRRSDVWGRRPVILIGLLGYGLSMALLATTIQLGAAGLLSGGRGLPAAGRVALRVRARRLGDGPGVAGVHRGAHRTRRARRRTGDRERRGRARRDARARRWARRSPPSGWSRRSTSRGARGAQRARDLVAPARGRPAARATGTAAPRSATPTGACAPFLAIGASLQAVRATTVITLALFLQDTFALTAAQAAQRAGIGFVALAAAGLFAQLVLVQRLRPTARAMIRWGVPLMLLAFVLLVVGDAFGSPSSALGTLGLGLGLVRPGSAAGASLAVTAGRAGRGGGAAGRSVGPGQRLRPDAGHDALRAVAARAVRAERGDHMPVVLLAMLGDAAHPRHAELSRDQEGRLRRGRRSTACRGDLATAPTATPAAAPSRPPKTGPSAVAAKAASWTPRGSPATAVPLAAGRGRRAVRGAVAPLQRTIGGSDPLCRARCKGCVPRCLRNSGRCCPSGHVRARVATPRAGTTPATLAARGLLLVAPMMTRIGGWRGVVVGAAFTLLVAGLQAVGRARATPAGPGELARDGGRHRVLHGCQRARPRLGVDRRAPGPRRMHEPLPGEP